MRNRWIAQAAVVALVMAVGTVAVAAIPDARGVIHACRNKQTGTLRVIDSESRQRCTKHEQALNWNQTGRRGRTGPQGPQGPQGPAGPPGTGSTGYQVLTERHDFPAPSDRRTGLYVSDVVECPSGKSAVNGGVQAVHPAAGTPEISPLGGWFEKGTFAVKLDATTIPSDVAEPNRAAVSGPTDTGWRVAGRYEFPFWGDPPVSSGDRGVAWEIYGGGFTLYAICVNV
jgi:hypothetical protein